MMTRAVSLLLFALVMGGCHSAQREASTLPPSERYDAVLRQARTLGREGRISRVQWSDCGDFVSFVNGDGHFRFDLHNQTLHELDEADAERNSHSRRNRVARGHQRDEELSPCGSWLARCEQWNVVLEAQDDDAQTVPVTTEGTRKHRFGKASWVYGEELRQTEAMWWSPDSAMLAYYELDERKVPDYYLTGGLTEWRSELLREGYPKAGDPNPIARLWVYHVDSERSVAIDVGDEDDQYIYNIRWSPDGDELIYSRLNRRQNTLELCAADPATGESRIVLTETQETWQDCWPELRFLDDGQRFLWSTETTGWNQYELRELDGTHLATLTSGDSPAAGIEHVDEQANVLYYTAYSDENPLSLQLHRVNLDGTGQVRLTGGSLHHTVNVSPDGAWFIARAQSLDTPPVTTLHSTDGSFVATLAEADSETIAEQPQPTPELFSFLADDGETVLYGVLHKPSDFDPRRTYPLLIDVYGGPFSQSVRNIYRPINATCEYGFLVAKIDNRGTANRGKAFADATYLKLGDVDLRDQVAGVKHLAQRPYVDEQRVGIYGMSYGGYLAALAMVKYPDVFHAAVASGAVTDWRHYDTIYTERFMRRPSENQAGYDAGSVVEHAQQLEGPLLIVHGMLDDNVHPSNAFHLADALQQADKHFDLMLYPTWGHRSGGHARNLRMRFFTQHLIDAGASQ